MAGIDRAFAALLAYLLIGEDKTTAGVCVACNRSHNQADGGLSYQLKS